MGRTGLVTALVACASVLACARDGLLDPPVAGVPSGGTAGAASAPRAPVASPREPLAAPPPVAGRWMMYGFEDSVGVDLRLDSQGGSYSVTGRGCDVWSGLFPPTPFSSDDSQRACGELGGQGVGPSLEFSFTFPSSIPPGGDVTYASSVQASKDGTRMAGSLTTGMAGRLGGPARRGYGWIRLADIGIDDGWNGYDPPRGPSADLGPFPVGANIELLLALQGDAPVGALLPGQTYVEKLDAGGSTVAWLAGDLGAYWNPDFHWDEATRTYTAGPVPETLPGFPVKLELHLNASDLGVRDAVVTMADGATGTLLPASP